MKWKNDWKWKIWGISSSLYSPIPPIVLPCPRVTILRFWPFWALTILKFTILTFFARMTYSGFWIDLWRSRARVELETRARGLERYKVAPSIGMWVLVQTGSTSWVEICRSGCRDSRLVLKLETSPPFLGGYPRILALFDHNMIRLKWTPLKFIFFLWIWGCSTTWRKYF